MWQSWQKKLDLCSRGEAYRSMGRFVCVCVFVRVRVRARVSFIPRRHLEAQGVPG